MSAAELDREYERVQLAMDRARAAAGDEPVRALLVRLARRWAAEDAAGRTRPPGVRARQLAVRLEALAESS